MNELLTAAECEKLMDGQCPDCGGRVLLPGPRGGLAQNILCGKCRNEFNTCGPLSTRIAKPCSPERQKVIYHLTKTNYPVAAFHSKRATYLEDLEAAIANGCTAPDCKHEHDPVEDIYFHQRCHAGAGVEVCYHKGSGVLTFNCRICHSPIITVAVAARPK
jgi:hypothetical protein